MRTPRLRDYFNVVSWLPENIADVDELSLDCDLVTAESTGIPKSTARRLLNLFKASGL